MRTCTSDVWTAVYKVGNSGCYSVQWGQPGGEEISRDLAWVFANNFLKDHKESNGKVPALDSVRMVIPVSLDSLHDRHH